MSKKRKITLSEESLVAALRNHERIGMEALYSMYSGALLGVIARIVVDDALAEDVLQETFIKIWHSAASYDATKGRLFTWMINIARNLAIDKVRSKDFKNQSKNQDIENIVTVIDEQQNTAYRPELMGVKDLVDKLKPDHKEVLDLVYFKGFTHTEAADQLNLPLGTVKTRVRAAIMQLRTYFN